MQVWQKLWVISCVYSASSLVMMRDAAEFPFLLHFARPTYSSLS